MRHVYSVGTNAVYFFQIFKEQNSLEANKPKFSNEFNSKCMAELLFGGKKC
jgi:hypothetical protein